MDSDIVSRIKQVMDYHSMNSLSLSKELGYKSSEKLSRLFRDCGAKPSYDIIYDISNKFEINTDWLITGRGSMTKSDKMKEPDIQIIHKPVYTEALIGNQEVFLYDIYAAANLKTLFLNKNQNILGKLSIPDIPKCDGAVYIRGDSMYPLLKSGDIIAYKEIKNIENILYGEMYLISFEIEGDEFLTVKYVNKSEFDGYLKLVSYNPHHDPKDIPLESVNAIGLVKLSIRKNTMI